MLALPKIPITNKNIIDIIFLIISTVLSSCGSESATSRSAENTPPLLLAANNGKTGTEVYVSDGTREGTHLLRDINKNHNSTPSSGFNLKKYVIIGRYDKDNKWGLWAIDKSNNNVYLLKNKDYKYLSISGYYVFDDELYFFVNKYDQPGIEFWKTDGTESGTIEILKYGDANNYYISDLVEFNGELYFTTSIAKYGETTLWRSDGTSEGTKKVKDIFSHIIEELVVSPDSTSIFIIEKRDTANSSIGPQIWASDGTYDGTKLIGESVQGEWISILSLLNNELFYFIFSYDRFDSGKAMTELWKTDGFELSKVTDKDIFSISYTGPEQLWHQHEFIGILDSEIFFLSKTWELWKTDGTESGTTRVSDLSNSASKDSYSILDDNALLFYVPSIAVEKQLWKTDGTDEGTFPVNSVFNLYFDSKAESISLDNKHVYFTSDVPEYGNEIWQSDGTLEGTEILKDIFPGNTDGIISDIYRVGNNIVFVGNDGISGSELWKSNGTKEGTSIIKDIFKGDGSSFIKIISATDDNIYFSAYDGTQQSIWKSDGTALGTSNFSHLTHNTTNPSFPGPAIKVGSNFYFVANEGGWGYEQNLWKTDGTLEGTTRVISFIGPDSLNNPSITRNSLFSVNNKLIFHSKQKQLGLELWASDGSKNGTKMIKDAVPEFKRHGIPYISRAKVGNTFYFRTDNALWKSNGLSSGTLLVTDKVDPIEFYGGKTLFYFTGKTDSHGLGLWVSDGTEKGTRLVKTISEEEYLFSGIVLNNNFIFRFTNESYGSEPWVSDGTSEGTKLLKDITPNRSSIPSWFTIFDDKVYFSATNSDNNQELWLTDGTSSNTVKIFEFTASFEYIQDLTSVGNTLFFTANVEGEKGDQLWKSDGTPGGTKKIKDNLYFRSFKRVGNKLFFKGNDVIHGWELWESDGTPEGTRMVIDLIEGETSGLHEIIYP